MSAAVVLRVANQSDLRQVVGLRRADGSAEPLTGVTRAVLSCAGVTLDSAVVGQGRGAAFDWETGANEGALVLHLADRWPPGQHADGLLTLYDATATQGVPIVRTAVHLVVSGALP